MNIFGMVGEWKQRNYYLQRLLRFLLFLYFRNCTNGHSHDKCPTVTDKILHKTYFIYQEYSWRVRRCTVFELFNNFYFILLNVLVWIKYSHYGEAFTQSIYLRSWFYSISWLKSYSNATQDFCFEYSCRRTSVIYFNYIQVLEYKTCCLLRILSQLCIRFCTAYWNMFTKYLPICFLGSRQTFVYLRIHVPIFMHVKHPLFA